MRDLPRRFDREAEAGGNLVGPFFQDRSLGHGEERAVDFHGSKTLAVVVKHLRVRQTLGVELALPRFLGIAAGAGVEVHGAFSKTGFGDSQHFFSLKYWGDAASGLSIANRQFRKSND